MPKLLEQPNEALVFRLYSLSGQLMAEQRLEGSGSHTLDISGLPAGLYFYQVRQGAKTIDQGKLIKE